jgi:hypothetical protein
MEYYGSPEEFLELTIDEIVTTANGADLVSTELKEFRECPAVDVDRPGCSGANDRCDIEDGSHGQLGPRAVHDSSWWSRGIAGRDLPIEIDWLDHIRMEVHHWRLQTW